MSILGAVHSQSRPIEGLSGRSFRAKNRVTVSSSPTSGMGTPTEDKGSHWTRGHGDARAMTAAGLDRDAASVPQIASRRTASWGLRPRSSLRSELCFGVNSGARLVPLRWPLRRLPIAGLVPGSKHRGAAALVTEQAPARALRSLPGWTKTRCLAPATADRRRGCSLSSAGEAKSGPPRVYAMPARAAVKRSELSTA